MDNKQFNDLVMRLDSINDSLKAISSKVSSIALFVWLPLVVALFCGMFFVGLLFVSKC